jgi:hypothetical protein
MLKMIKGPVNNELKDNWKINIWKILAIKIKTQ